MKLGNYFDETQGTGILATADRDGRVNAAIYARPHLLEDGTLAFVARDRLTRLNLQSNPYAVYLFIETGAGYAGRRLYLRKLREEEDSEDLNRLKRRKSVKPEQRDEKRFLLVFALEKMLPLVGAGDDVPGV